MTNQTFPWTYWAYGFPLRSEVEIPVFLPYSSDHAHLNDRSEKDDWITIGINTSIAHDHWIPSSVAQESIAVQVKEDEILLYIKDIASFSIQHGQTIQCSPAPNVETARISLALSGVVMSALLFQRGCFIVHGSAVSVSGKGVLFLGDSGAGKSSLAIALHQRGYSIVTDDLAAVLYRDGVPYLLPAFPQMRVTRESAAALRLQWDTLLLLPNIPKRGFRFEAEFQAHALPLRHIYILKQSVGLAPVCQSIPGPQQVMELMHHSEVMSLFEEDKIHHFRVCAALAQAISMQYFERPMNWNNLQTSLEALTTSFELK